MRAFVFKRRLGRLSFAVVAVALFVAWAFATMEPHYLHPSGEWVERRGLDAGRLAVKAAFLLAVICRLHDLGLSGWWALAVVSLEGVMTMFLPALLLPRFVTVAFFSLVRGQPGDNKWGRVPWPVKRGTGTLW